MTEMPVPAGAEINKTVLKALGMAPCFFDFNGCRIEVTTDMVGHPDAPSHLYKVYNALLSGLKPPVWNAKGAEKPCKQCRRNNFIADKKCWWCEIANPCT